MSYGALSHLVTDNAACLKYCLLGTDTGGYVKPEGKDRHCALFTAEHMKNLIRHTGISEDQLLFTISANTCRG